ncbi:hypothetical protein Sjap_017114 [Stephania japonica]|uniref:Nucleobase-ascorbate transporter 11 n=1 Tax=Stephania japonica TaxID=461633 RepID=A0AAP0I5J9_9MAGN
MPISKQGSMENGSSSESKEKPEIQKGRHKPGPWPPNEPPRIDPFVPRTDHNPRELKSWAKKTGFNPNLSGETIASVSERNESSGFDLEKGLDRGGAGSSPKIEIDPILGRTRENGGGEIEAVNGGNGLGPFGGLRSGNERNGGQKKRVAVEPVPEVKEGERKAGLNGNEMEVPMVAQTAESNKGIVKDEEELDVDGFMEDHEAGSMEPSRPHRMRYGLRENPSYALLIYYGLQHYLSIAGSLILIPLIIVPAMGGSDKDTATVISTMLLVSGITTILHSFFGTRLPLVQGSSFGFLAPALVILNSQDFRNLTENSASFSIIINAEIRAHNERVTRSGHCWITFPVYPGIHRFDGSFSKTSIDIEHIAFIPLSPSYVMIMISWFYFSYAFESRLINPVVVAPTVAAIGLAFFSYGFPQAGSCIEISIPQILVVLIFTLYLRGVSIFGHRIFRVYAVPLSVAIVWVYAAFLTAGGAYNYKGCNPDLPSSNILSDSCRKHVYTMKHCRTDASSAWRTANWVRVPYPFQWGIPTFHFRTSFIMLIVSLVMSVDSVGTYHSTAMLVTSKAPSPGIVSRGIGLEGFCSLLAGLWGTGTGSSTLTENVYTIEITKMASRRAIEVGAVFLILFSFVGKIGALLASIPISLAASVLCFIWALIVALGLSTLQYGQTKSFRNIAIVGVSLFLSLSIPAYFQQYQPDISFILPSYLIPFAAASNGPVHTSSKDFDYAINGLMSLNMVIAFFVAFILDNTVPGSRQERGVYIWSSADDVFNDPSLLADYSLPRRVTRFFNWAKCVGT